MLSGGAPGAEVVPVCEVLPLGADVPSGEVVPSAGVVCVPGAYGPIDARLAARERAAATTTMSSRRLRP